MSGGADTWMPLYLGDYFKATRRLTTEQHGAYLLLIMDYWDSGPPPDDDTTLAAITGLSPDAWRMHRACLQQFFRVAGGKWTHKRIDAEKAKALAYAEARSERARVAANARWNAEGNAPSMPQALPGECPLPSPSPSHIQSNEEGEPSSCPGRVWQSPPCVVTAQVWADFKTNRKRKRLSNTPTTYKKLCDDLARVSEASGMSPSNLLMHAAAKGWGGIYDPNEDKTNGKRSDKPSNWELAYRSNVGGASGG